MQQKEKPKDYVGDEMRSKIKELGRLWKKKAEKNALVPAKKVLDAWEQLIDDWIEDESMPLIIRKGGSRGQEFEHPSGRKIIISDNTFALWVYHHVLKGEKFTISEMKRMLYDGEIPMVYILSKEDRMSLKYTKPLGKFSLSDSDTKWKLCHIVPVGLNSRKSIDDIKIGELKDYFRKYANPKNMFLLPKEIGGLGEIQEFIDEQKV